jgi:hypothetical protein
MRHGAVYYNCYYPGLFGVPVNSAFTVHSQDHETMLYVVRHLRPVVITDFGNDFTYIEEGARRYLALSRPIPTMDRELLYLDIRTTAGDVETIAAYGKQHEYAVYRRQAFTEITVGAEVANVENHGVRADIIFTAIDKFLSLYRLVTRDVRVVPSGRLVRDFPIIRERIVRYTDFDPFTTRQQRLVDHIPSRFQPIIFSYKEYEQFLPVFHHHLADAALRLGHHLAVDTELSDAQEALVDSYEMLTTGGSSRFALVEALSIAEVVAFDFISEERLKDPELDRSIRREERRYRLTLRKAVTLLKDLLGDALKLFPGLIPGMYKALNARNKTLHERAEVTQEEALGAINAVQSLIFTIEAYRKTEGERDAL